MPYTSLGTEARCGARFFSDSDGDYDAMQVFHFEQDENTKTAAAGAAHVSAPQRCPSQDSATCCEKFQRRGVKDVTRRNRIELISQALRAEGDQRASTCSSISRRAPLSSENGEPPLRTSSGESSHSASKDDDKGSCVACVAIHGDALKNRLAYKTRRVEEEQTRARRAVDSQTENSHTSDDSLPQQRKLVKVSLSLSLSLSPPPPPSLPPSLSLAPCPS